METTRYTDSSKGLSVVSRRVSRSRTVVNMCDKHRVTSSNTFYYVVDAHDIGVCASACAYRLLA